MAFQAIYRYLDTNGDGTGTKSVIGDYSAAPVAFKVVPPVGQIYRLHRMIVHIQDSANPSADVYGNLASALAVGLVARVMNASGLVLDLTDGTPIKTNAGWGLVCYDVSVDNFGSGDDFIQVRWSFDKSGAPLHLDGNAGTWFEVLANDNFVGLAEHRFNVQGQRSYE